MNKLRCAAIAKSGKQCKKKGVVDSQGYCAFHSQEPQYIEARRMAGKLGGTSNKGYNLAMRGYKIKDPADLHMMLTKMLEMIGRGSIDVTPGVLKILPSLSKEWREVYSMTELSKRLEKVEKQKS